MADDPRDVSARLLLGWAREPGRSVLARVELDGEDAPAWEHGVAPDAARPAASILKLPLATAIERAFAEGRLDPAARVGVGSVVATAGVAGPLHLLDPDATLAVGEVLGLCLSLSDRACATWLLDAVGIDAVRAAAVSAGCDATTIEAAPDEPAGPLVGTTTARDALRLLLAAVDEKRSPLAARALRNSVRDSRIPLGATDLDVSIAHKTGSLGGVAHDVALLDCRGGRLAVAFLTEAQHDTLVTGYEMGICTRCILEAWGLAVRRTRSVA